MPSLQDYPLGVTAVMLPELDFEQQVKLCSELGVTHYTYRPRVIGDAQKEQPYSNWGNHKFDLTPQRLVEEGAALKAQLEAAGLTPFGTVPHTTTASSDEDIELAIKGAAAGGAGRARINPAPYPNEPFDYPAYVDAVVGKYREIVAEAQKLGQKLVMETHAHSSVAGCGLAYNICKHFDPAEVSVIFDLPNFAREGNHQPVLAVSVIGPWIDHVHIGGARRVTTGYDAKGCRTIAEQFCPMAESDMYMPAWLEALDKAGIHCPLVIEEYNQPVPGAQRLRDAVTTLRRLLD